MSAGTYDLLVLAKAPFPGVVKTRLGASIGDRGAAEVAAASLLDTLETCTAAVGATRCHLALSGDLAGCVGERGLRDALTGWSVRGQRGADFATRLANAHRDAGEGPMVQIGMDTPHVSVAQLDSLAAGLDRTAAVLGPAADGGWWGLGRRGPEVAGPLAGVRMSTPATFADTRAALLAAGHSVGVTTEVTDVDTAEDADLVAALAPGSRFARAWTAARAGVVS